MFRTAVLRSALAARTALRPATSTIKTSLAARSRTALAPFGAAVAAPRAPGFSAVRFYSAGGDGLVQAEVEGRIMSLLQGFDKVCTYVPTSRSYWVDGSGKMDLLLYEMLEIVQMELTYGFTFAGQ
jgi:hypothetical protein